ncbi:MULTISPECIES: type VI secretion system baseplate subunit TssF [unclassified Vibrio]|uniref:type VI secretion system baseplate subunit TssF n=1 Tax=unclassified Vibrio TaxID=2614977 RepID=UPI001361B771|nr:type VI secretion system baseplate subunit TssF [Vibrio sp. V36_P2S2PM302]NAX23280.1 type VI secretion system baseplate subunit TssF [Vibrio sp. V39_P1S14PM300]NAX26754.1 type VI secretion system baseplate subunit TssF [Vibrio sp. V38_P2S17PM301]NAX29955.1 type VI secretion system baseplate subunit TssF [Vibrio sp. V37_P2S8PM304]
MSSSKYFQDELTYLREAGSEFAKYHPKLTNFLSEGTYDPDVERLMEGFAFLTGRIREKIDDELPELTQSLMTLLWPHYMRSVPSMCITELSPHVGSVTERTVIARGAEMASEQVESTQCLFRSCYDVDLYPVRLTGIEQANSRTSSTVDVSLSTEHGLELSRLKMDSLRFHLHGEVHITRTLYLWLFRYLDYVELDVGGGYKHRLRADQIKPVGFAENEAILPYSKNSFSGYRLLQEYFSLPEKFMFFDVTGLEWLKGIPQRSTLKFSFVFKRALPSEVVLKDKHFKLHCTPAVNLFSIDADPIRLEHRRNEYKVRPQTNSQEHFEVYSIEEVQSWSKSERRRKKLIEFESFEHQINQRDKREFYKTKVGERINGRGLERYISFHTHDSGIADLGTETVLMKLVCSNADLAERLSVGDITYTTHKSPTYATFRNITKPTQSVSPQINGELQWQLIANMSLNYLSLANIDVLKVLLSTYDFHSRVDRQAHRASIHRLDGIRSSEMEPIDRVFRGVAVRGTQFNLIVNSSYFVNEGDMFLLASVLNEFIRLYSSLNSFTELEVFDEKTGEVYHWPSLPGKQTVL